MIVFWPKGKIVAELIGGILSIMIIVIWVRFQTDMTTARANAGRCTPLVATPCGPIEYQDAGTGVPLLAVHGGGGGHGQGMAFAAPLIVQGIRTHVSSVASALG